MEGIRWAASARELVRVGLGRGGGGGGGGAAKGIKRIVLYCIVEDGIGWYG